MFLKSLTAVGCGSRGRWSETGPKMMPKMTSVKIVGTDLIVRSFLAQKQTQIPDGDINGIKNSQTTDLAHRPLRNLSGSDLQHLDSRQDCLDVGHPDLACTGLYRMANRRSARSISPHLKDI